MSDVVERVARAMRERYNAEFHAGGTLIPFEISAARGAWLECARAAIEAMREPTVQMTQAACDATFGPAPLSPEAAHSIGYRAMITEALK